MASVFRWKGAWNIKWRDGAGRWRSKRTACVTKLEAKQLARDLERKAERQRAGVEPLPSEAPKWTFSDLMDWWWGEYGCRLRSDSIRPTLEKHLRGPLGSLLLIEVTSARIEELLNARAESPNHQDGLSPETLNKLRMAMHRMFSLAIRTGRWHGPNPAAAVQRRKVPKRLPEYLRDWEISPIMAALPPKRRPLFATALYTGMRQGELLGLRKSDLDLEAGTIAVSRSYDGPTVKGARAALLPIVDGLRPYLVAAIQASPSEVVFPREDGSMQPRNVGPG